MPSWDRTEPCWCFSVRPVGDRIAARSSWSCKARSKSYRNVEIGLAAISYDAVDVLSAFAQEQGITFPLLSDLGSRTIREYGILNPVPRMGAGSEQRRSHSGCRHRHLRVGHESKAHNDRDRISRYVRSRDRRPGVVTVFRGFLYRTEYRVEHHHAAWSQRSSC